MRLPYQEVAAAFRSLLKVAIGGLESAAVEWDRLFAAFRIRACPRLITSTANRELVFRGPFRGRRTSRKIDTHEPLVESHVPHRRGLLFDAGVPAEYRVSGGRRAGADRDARSGHPDAVRCAADVRPRRRHESARPGQHRDPRKTVPAME